MFCEINFYVLHDDLNAVKRESNAVVSVTVSDINEKEGVILCRTDLIRHKVNVLKSGGKIRIHLNKHDAAYTAWEINKR